MRCLPSRACLSLPRRWSLLLTWRLRPCAEATPSISADSGPTFPAHPTSKPPHKHGLHPPWGTRGGRGERGDFGLTRKNHHEICKSKKDPTGPNRIGQSRIVLSRMGLSRINPLAQVELAKGARPRGDMRRTPLPALDPPHPKGLLSPPLRRSPSPLRRKPSPLIPREPPLRWTAPKFRVLFFLFRLLADWWWEHDFSAQHCSLKSTVRILNMFFFSCQSLSMSYLRFPPCI